MTFVCVHILYMCDPPQVTSVALCNAGLSKLSCLDQLPNLQWLSLSDNALSSLEVCPSDDDMTILSVWCFFCSVCQFAPDWRSSVWTGTCLIVLLVLKDWLISSGSLFPPIV